MEEQFEKGEVVWAKVKGFSWWPAIVSKIHFSKDKVFEYTINFVGEDSYAVVQNSKICKYKTRYDEFTSNKKNKKLLSSIQSADRIYNKLTTYELEKKYFAHDQGINKSSKEKDACSPSPNTKSFETETVHTLKKETFGKASKNDVASISTELQPPIKKPRGRPRENKSIDKNQQKKPAPQSIDLIAQQFKPKNITPKKRAAQHKLEETLEMFLKYIISKELTHENLTLDDLNLNIFDYISESILQESVLDKKIAPKIYFLLKMILRWLKEYQKNYSKESLPEYFLMMDKVSKAFENLKEKLWSEWSSFDDFLQNVQKSMFVEEIFKPIRTRAIHQKTLSTILNNKNSPILLESPKSSEKKSQPKSDLKKRKNAKVLEIDAIQEEVPDKNKEPKKLVNKVTNIECEKKLTPAQDIIKNQSTFSCSNSIEAKTSMDNFIEKKEFFKETFIKNNALNFEKKSTNKKIHIDKNNNMIAEKKTTTTNAASTNNRLEYSHPEASKSINSTSTNIDVKKNICLTLLTAFKQVCPSNISTAQKCSFAVERALSQAYQTNSAHYKEKVKDILSSEIQVLDRILKIQQQDLNFNIDAINECLRGNFQIEAKKEESIEEMNSFQV